jgi:type IV secretory pathway TrbF-like protein
VSGDGKRVLHSARRERDERHGHLVLGKRNWQITSAGLMLLSLILALGIVWVRVLEPK